MNVAPEAWAPMTRDEVVEWLRPRLRRIVSDELALVRQRLTILEGQNDV